MTAGPKVAGLRSGGPASGLARHTLAPRAPVGRFVRYGLASASGTLVDLMAMGLLVWGGLAPGLAAACGYALGTLWHWQVSSRLVFADRLAEQGSGRRRQQVLFVGSALLGLALTTAIVTIATMQGVAPHYAKLAAMGAAFASVWLVRLAFVFAEDTSGGRV
jgi:putative flippase GtrA